MAATCSLPAPTGAESGEMLTSGGRLSWSVATKRAIPIVLRLVAAIGGGYAVAAGLAALAAVGLPAATALPRSEAATLASMLAFLVYLALLIWAFAEPRLARLCCILVAAGIVSWGGAWGLVRLVSGT